MCYTCRFLNFQPSIQINNVIVGTSLEMVQLSGPSDVLGQ